MTDKITTKSIIHCIRCYERLTNDENSEGHKARIELTALEAGMRRTLKWRYLESQYMYELVQPQAVREKLGVIRHTRENAIMLTESLGLTAEFVEDESDE